MVAPRLTLVPWDARYAVTRDGRVFSRAKRGVGDRRIDPKWRQLSPVRTGSRRQYLTVCLGLGNRWDVHKLVAAVFHGPCPDGFQVRHKDGNPSNNSASNLEYGTALENAGDAIRHGTTCRGESNARSRLTSGQVSIIRRRFESGELQRSIAADIGVSAECVSQVVRGTRWGWLNPESVAVAARNCEECGQTITNIRHGRRFCTERCGNRNYARRWRARRKGAS